MNSFEKWFDKRFEKTTSTLAIKAIAREGYIAGLRRDADRLREAAALAHSEAVQGALSGHAFNIEAEAKGIEQGK